MATHYTIWLPFEKLQLVTTKLHLNIKICKYTVGPRLKTDSHVLFPRAAAHLSLLMQKVQDAAKDGEQQQTQYDDHNDHTAALSCTNTHTKVTF